MLACTLHCFMCCALARLPHYRGNQGGGLRLATTLSMHAVTAFLPLFINTARLVYGGTLPPRSGGLALVSSAARTGHALVVFGFANWLQTMSIAALGWPQTPALHLAIQGAKAALLAGRARSSERPCGRGSHAALWGAAAQQKKSSCMPAQARRVPHALSPLPPPSSPPSACLQYLALDPVHTQVVRTAHWAHRQAAVILSPVSLAALDAAASADDLAQCQAVVWSVQVGDC